MMAQIYQHNSPNTLLALLRPVLPASLPLVRRLQFYLHRDCKPQSSLLATFPETTTVLPSKYVAAFCDRVRGPETHCWLFSSFELAAAAAEPSTAETAECAEQLVALMQMIKNL